MGLKDSFIMSARTEIKDYEVLDHKSKVVAVELSDCNEYTISIEQQITLKLPDGTILIVDEGSWYLPRVKGEKAKGK